MGLSEKAGWLAFFCRLPPPGLERELETELLLPGALDDTLAGLAPARRCWGSRLGRHQVERERRSAALPHPQHRWQSRRLKPRRQAARAQCRPAAPGGTRRRSFPCERARRLLLPRRG